MLIGVTVANTSIPLKMEDGVVSRGGNFYPYEGISAWIVSSGPPWVENFSPLGQGWGENPPAVKVEMGMGIIPPAPQGPRSEYIT